MKNLLKMNNMKHLACLAIACLCFASTVKAQLPLPVKTIGNAYYYYYEVKNRETLSEVAQLMGVTVEDVVRYNPDAANGLFKKQMLFLPVDDYHTPDVLKPDAANVAVAKKSHVVDESDKPVTHLVKSGETIYGLSRAYGITQDELIAANPRIAKGLKAGETIVIPLPKKPSKKVEEAFAEVPDTTAKAEPRFVFYTLAANDNLYTVAKKFNTQVPSILTLNPRLTPDKYVEGEVVKVEPGNAIPIFYDKETVRFINYKVEDEESFYSIARRFGVTTDELIAANPDVKKPRRGKVLLVPQRFTMPVRAEVETMPLAEMERYYSPIIDNIYETIVSDRHNTEINIAIILPFQLHKEAAPKQAYLYTDFYKGFLIAVDSLKNDIGKKVNLSVYDTQHNLNITDSLLKLPALKDMDMIIAPSEPKQLERINAFGQENNVPVINCFSAKNDDYLNNPMVYQVNTPTSTFTKNVLRWFDTQFNDYNVIYLEDTDTDDKEIFSDIKTHIQSNGQYSTSLSVGTELSYSKLSNAMNPGTKYVFIPSSGNKEILRKTVKALKQTKSERFDCEMVLLGYPEYMLYLKDYQTDLQDIDTYMFARFFNSKGFRTRDIEALYSRWFGGSMLVSYPNMCLLGFDTAMFLLKSLDANNRIDEQTPQHRGIQTSFRFERETNWGGYVNQAIDIVHFSTDHQIETMVK